MEPKQLEIPNHFGTERLNVRRYQASDAGWYYAVGQKNKLHLAQFEAENVICSLNSTEEAEKALWDMQADWEARKCFFMGAFEKRSGEFVAQLYIGVVDWGLPELEVGYFVDKDYEGKGYVTEMVRGALQFIFDHLQARRVSLRCDDTNVRSYRVAERCGFRQEAHLRENKRQPDGTISGTLVYGLLREEYEREGSTGQGGSSLS